MAIWFYALLHEIGHVLAADYERDAVSGPGLTEDIRDAHSASRQLQTGHLPTWPADNGDNDDGLVRLRNRRLGNRGSPHSS